ncbi:hypothetical protein BKA70DRAFT_1239826 [Coprinopsis sp. MPI-PUGE-AT-0042]|nr:hypothetical protein BKA70DRAFT_1239826 [Coprinopsis sp. MPI-PUGE-AT-0042]
MKAPKPSASSQVSRRGEENEEDVGLEGSCVLLEADLRPSTAAPSLIVSTPSLYPLPLPSPLALQIPVRVDLCRGESLLVLIRRPTMSLLCDIGSISLTHTWRRARKGRPPNPSDSPKHFERSAIGRIGPSTAGAVRKERKPQQGLAQALFEEGKEELGWKGRTWWALNRGLLEDQGWRWVMATARNQGPSGEPIGGEQCFDPTGYGRDGARSGKRPTSRHACFPGRVERPNGMVPPWNAHPFFLVSHTATRIILNVSNHKTSQELRNGTNKYLKDRPQVVELHDPRQGTLAPVMLETGGPGQGRMQANEVIPTGEARFRCGEADEVLCRGGNDLIITIRTSTENRGSQVESMLKARRRRSRRSRRILTAIIQL